MKNTQNRHKNISFTFGRMIPTLLNTLLALIVLKALHALKTQQTKLNLEVKIREIISPIRATGPERKSMNRYLFEYNSSYSPLLFLKNKKSIKNMILIDISPMIPVLFLIEL